MPLITNTSLGNYGKIGIWKISESEEFFVSKLSVSSSEKAELDQINIPQKRLHWLAARHILNSLSGLEKREHLNKDEFGKPFYKKSNQHFSLSHSGNFAAALLGPDQCGLDIQTFEQKISKIVPRILSGIELQKLAHAKDDEILMTTFAWSAKEAVYKAYGKKKLDFKKHILINSILKEGDIIKAEIELRKENVNINYEVTGWFDSEFVIVSAIKSMK